MVFKAFLTMNCDCGQRRIQDNVQKYTILVMMGLIIRFLIVTCYELKYVLFTWKFGHILIENKFSG
jgi:hypothetical protein